MPLVGKRLVEGEEDASILRMIVRPNQLSALVFRVSLSLPGLQIMNGLRVEDIGPGQADGKDASDALTMAYLTQRGFPFFVSRPLTVDRKQKY